MIRILSFFLLITFLSPALAHPTNENAQTNIVVDELVRIYDGDTITVNIDMWPPLLGKEISIRVRGVDTPEIRGECQTEKDRAYAARDFAEKKLREAHVITLRNPERGKYFRLIADVYYDGKNLSDALIQNGYGRPYEGGSRDGWCGD